MTSSSVLTYGFRCPYCRQMERERRAKWIAEGTLKKPRKASTRPTASRAARDRLPPDPACG